MNQPCAQRCSQVQGRRWIAACCLVTAIACFDPASLLAQAKKAPAKPDDQQFEEVTLDTKDGVALWATYYPGPEKKTTVPLILLHDWNGSRADFHMLATFLQQSLSHAVIVPDLRGHGMSVRQQQTDVPIERDKLTQLAIRSMWLDVETVKTYLLQRNNEGKLNIEQLGVIGTGYGALLALDWAVRDWNVRDLPTYKMGRDVKALILISPLQSFKGVNVNMALRDRNMLSQVSLLTVVGQQDARRYSDAKRILKSFQQVRRDDTEAALPILEIDTDRQGLDLVYDPNLETPVWIRQFIEQRLVQRAAEFPWTDRTSPLK